MVLLPFYTFGTKKREHSDFVLISSKTFLSKNFLQAGSTKKNIINSSYFIILTLIIIGLSRPRILDKIKETSIEVVDMILVLDISSSMLADDFKPNRLEAVKKTAIDFIGSRKSDRIGIIVFAGESFINVH